jgi:adenine-specific DNA glycosylase
MVIPILKQMARMLQQGTTSDLRARIMLRLVKELDALGVDYKHEELQNLTNAMLEVFGDYTQSLMDIGTTAYKEMKGRPRKIRNPVR